MTPSSRTFRACLVRALPGAAAAVALSLGAPGGAHADVRVEGVDDPELRALIDAVLPDSGDPDNRVEARRMARDAESRIDTLLRSQGYYGAELDARAEGDETFEAVVLVDLGPRFLIESITYDVEGDEIAQSAVLPGPSAPAAVAIGDPLAADPVLAEEASAVARLRLGGYPDATPLPRDIVVDHATDSATVIYRIDAGQPAAFGELVVDADTEIRPRWAQRLVTFRTGEPYSPEHMETLSTRLSGTGAFDTVSVRLAPAAGEGEGAEPRNVIAEITQGDRHTIELGAGYGTSEGVRLEAEWQRRNMFGGAERLTVDAVGATLEQSLRVELRAPHFGRPNRTATGSALAINEDKDAYDRTAGVLFAGAEQPVSAFLTAGVGVSLERSRVSDAATPNIARDFNILSLPGELRYDRTDDLLDPTEGLRGAIRLEPGVAAGDDSLTFVRIVVDVSAYQQIGGVVLAGRARVGSIYGATAADLPADRRFYAGGGGSVRGYEYQSLGPRDALGNPLGGRSLFEVSAEARFRVTGNWGGVVFLDAGTTRRGQIPEFRQLSVGGGVGVRYYTVFGPIRADIGIPLTRRAGDRAYQFYLSIGQAF